MTAIAGLEVHEAAELFPLITGADFDALVADIKANGQMEPVVLDGESRIIDGRNRARACEVLNIRPVTKRYDADNVVQFVVSHNLHRRHLTDSQRAMIAARLATRAPGRRSQSGDITTLPPTLDDASEMLAVNKTSVQKAKTVQRDGTPELQALVAEGHAPVTTAARVATEMTHDEQNAYVETVRGGADPVKSAPPDLKQHGYDKARPKPAADPRLAMPQPSKMGGNHRRHLGIIDALLVVLSGASLALDEITTLDQSVTAEEATRLTGDLSKQIRTLSRVNQLIKERTTQ
jgi:ParB-like chromosome segregation protein Spo0J